MIRSMYSGVAGMLNHQIRMDVIGNNISNENTTAYKAARANFKDTLYQTIGAAPGAGGGFQVGTGVSISGVTNNFNQGALEPTGRKLDLAISGNGFFGVADDEGNMKYTRDGSFFFDKEGFLLNSTGLYVVDPSGNKIQIQNLSDRENVAISETGELYKTDFDPGTGTTSETNLGQIGLFNFQNAAALTKIGDNLFLENDNTGERLSNEQGTEGFGTINSGFIETSNLNIIDELANLIATQRGYQASAKVFTTADEVLREIIELKR